METTDKDINEVFDDLLLSEDNFVREGFEEGYEQSKLTDDFDAYHVGFHKGLTFGAELGYYFGTLTRLTEEHELPEKYMVDVRKLKETIERVPQFNDLTLDIEASVGNIRSQFKRLCVNLKLKHLEFNVQRENWSF